jgi:hypothetical protein
MAKRDTDYRTHLFAASSQVIPLDQRKHDLIDPRFLGWVVDLKLAQ